MSDAAGFHAEPVFTRPDGTQVVEEEDVVENPNSLLDHLNGMDGVGHNTASEKKAHGAQFPPLQSQVQVQPTSTANLGAVPENSDSSGPGPLHTGNAPAGNTTIHNTQPPLGSQFPPLQSQIPVQPTLGPNIAALPSNLNGSQPIPWNTGNAPAGNTTMHNTQPPPGLQFPPLQSQIPMQPTLGPNIAALPSNLNGSQPPVVQQFDPLQPHVPVQSTTYQNLQTTNVIQSSGTGSSGGQGYVENSESVMSDSESVMSESVMSGREGDLDGEENNDDDDHKTIKDLNDEQKLAIVNKIAELPSENTDEAGRMLQSIVPKGYGISLMDFRIIIHPDRWVVNEVAHANAEQAFRRLEHFIHTIEQNEGSRNNRKDWLIFHSEDRQYVLQNSDGGLRLYHIHAHKEATRHLQTLSNVVAKGEPEGSEKSKSAKQALDEINKFIEKTNSENNHPTDLGIVDYTRFLGLWRAIADQYTRNGSNQNTDELMLPLRRFCGLQHYPRGWKTAPPSDDNTYDSDVNYWGTLYTNLNKSIETWYKKCLAEGPAAEYRQHFGSLSNFKHELKQINDAHQQEHDSHRPQMKLFAAALCELAYHARNRNAAGYSTTRTRIAEEIKNKGYPNCWLPDAIDTSDWPALGLEGSALPGLQQPARPMGVNNIPRSNTHVTNGRHKLLAFAPHVTQRCIKAGYTSTGEKIHYIQPLGIRANFVVQTSDGKYRLVSSASAGGKPAIEGAKQAGVPETIQDPSKVQEMRAMIQIGGHYGLFFVAPAAWDTASPRLPWFVVGFHYSGNNKSFQVAISRSNLGKILSPRQADQLIVEVIAGHTDLPLREALESQVALAALENERSFPQWSNIAPGTQRIPSGVQGAVHSQPVETQLGSFPPEASIPKQRMSLPWEVQEPWWFQVPRSQRQPQNLQPQYAQGQQFASPQQLYYPQFQDFYMKEQRPQPMQAQFPLTHQQLPFMQQQYPFMQQQYPIMQQQFPIMQQQAQF
ncbi:hypothetical protein BBP40_007900 [Aspergillus hancockii]|nr:hypothetical protein BBP40_007900 [Aspergillus hancockii]